LKIGILEDDIAQSELLDTWLNEEGHSVFISGTAKGFLELFKKEALDLVILDWHLPDMTGIEVLELLRGKFDNSLPVIFSTQRTSEEDIVRALTAGADDYISKPVRKAELLARLTALGRRAGVSENESSNIIDIGPLRLNLSEEQITRDGEAVKMTRKDYLVAKLFFQEQGKVLSREYLLRSVWGIEGIDTRTVDVHVSRVRRSLGIGPEMGYLIKTIYQHGYRLEKVADNN